MGFGTVDACRLDAIAPLDKTMHIIVTCCPRLTVTSSAASPCSIVKSAKNVPGAGNGSPGWTQPAPLHVQTIGTPLVSTPISPQVRVRRGIRLENTSRPASEMLPGRSVDDSGHDPAARAVLGWRRPHLACCHAVDRDRDRSATEPQGVSRDRRGASGVTLAAADDCRCRRSRAGRLRLRQPRPVPQALRSARPATCRHWHQPPHPA